MGGYQMPPPENGRCFRTIEQNQKRRHMNMSESKMNNGQVAAKQGTSENLRSSEASQPVFTPGRFFNLSPFALMREFTDEMDRAFGGRADGMAAAGWAPAIDIQQCNGMLTVSAELPGLRRDDVKVEVVDDNLVIEGERKLEHQADHDGVHRRERIYGRFYRAIPLPEGTRTDQLKAELQDGVLRVSAPVPEIRKTPRFVPIEEGRPNRAAA
jgi:HSP20 family protein